MYERAAPTERPSATRRDDDTTDDRAGDRARDRRRDRRTRLPDGVQAKLTVGSVDDPLEHEADRVADQVVRSLASPAATDADSADSGGEASPADGTLVAAPATVGRISRRRDVGAAEPEVGPEGGAVSDDVSSRIRSAAGGGSSLPDGVRTRMESAFGTDLGGVRIHRSSDLAPRLGAEAFTAGRDIHFAPGRFQPSSSAGLHLLGHELTHVVQQTGTVPRKVDRDAGLPRTSIAPSAAGGGHDAHRRAAAGVDAPAEVRRDRRSDVVRASFGKKVKGFVKGAKSKAKALFGKAEAQPDTETGDDDYDSVSHEQKMANQRKYRGSGPGENPDYTNTALWGQEPDRYVVTLAAAQENPEWLNNINALKKVAIKQILSSPKKILGDMDGAQEHIIRKTLLSQGKLTGKDEAETTRLIEEFTHGIHDVGHTWVRLGTYVGGQLKELYTYGMWPQKLYSPGHDDDVGGYAGFMAPGPGEVRHPDIAHERDAMKVYKDYEVSTSSFDRALDTAIDRYNSPPPYVLTGYNCTAFAREVLIAAGKSYPGSGVLPGMAYTPGDLYWAIAKEFAKGKKGARQDDDHPEAIDRIEARTGAFSKAGKSEVRTEYWANTESGRPKDTAPTKDVTLYAGNWLSFGEKPNRFDQQLKLDADMEVTVVADRDFRDKWEAVPIKFGSYFWYVDEDSYLRAKVPLGGRAPKGGTNDTGGHDDVGGSRAKLAVYNGTSGNFKPPAPDSDPIRQLTLEEAKGLIVQSQDGPWSEVYDRRTGDIFWAISADLQALVNPTVAPVVTVEDDAVPAALTANGVIEWFACSSPGLGLWKADGTKIDGIYRSQGKQVGSTGRTTMVGTEMYVEFVIEETTAWMPEAWWFMYFEQPYPTERAVVDVDDTGSETSDLEDQVDDSVLLGSDDDAWTPEMLADAMPMVVAALATYAGSGLYVLDAVISNGVDGLDKELIRILLSGDGAKERCAQLAAAVGEDPDDFMSMFGP